MSFEPLNQDGMNNYYDSTWQAQESLGEYTAKTYMWMFLGLLLTFGIGFSGYASGLVLYAFQTPFAIPVLTGLELITVLVLSMKITTLSIGMARFLFLFYSALNGIVFSVYFLMFGVADMMFIFAATAVFFGTMAIVAKVFRIDVSGLRPLMFGGLSILGPSKWCCATRESSSSCCSPPTTPEKSVPCIRPTAGIRRCWRNPPSSLHCSCTWTSSTCSCTSCVL